MATVVSLLANLHNSAFDQQQHPLQHQQHHPKHCFSPYGESTPEALLHRTVLGGRRTEPSAYYSQQQPTTLEAIDFQLLCRSLEEEFEQMEFTGGSSTYQYQQQQHEQQPAPQQQQQSPQQSISLANRRQQDYEQINTSYNLDNEDSYSGSPNNFQDYQNNFVDSPPDSKESWPVDYNKMHNTAAASTSGGNEAASSPTTNAVVVAAAAAAVVAAASSQQDGGGAGSYINNNAILPSRKRRMEWMSPQEEDTDGSDIKIANIDKEREVRRKVFLVCYKYGVSERLEDPTIEIRCPIYCDLTSSPWRFAVADATRVIPSKPTGSAKRHDSPATI
ncbi:hypothetical protein AND_001627 [Anopheles darlingi]|uniref:Uncharacterized protein n=1 Tax=Anopheles darlingi TaxID=43151 RepID=W5JQ88_ANODA|nr:hypothetical protein AND_001627 [Anopheles darlingi]